MTEGGGWKPVTDEEMARADAEYQALSAEDKAAAAKHFEDLGKNMTHQAEVEARFRVPSRPESKLRAAWRKITGRE